MYSINSQATVEPSNILLVVFSAYYCAIGSYRRRHLINTLLGPGVRFTKVFRTELGHKYIIVACSVIALCLPVMSKISRYKLVCYK